MKFRKEKVIREDGRYAIFYYFSEKNKRPQGKEPRQPSGEPPRKKHG